MLPISIIDKTTAEFKTRKLFWDKAGLDGTAGRPENTNGLRNMGQWAYNKAHQHDADFDPSNYNPKNNGTSEFHPAICEWVYEFYGRPDMRVIDPFSGGSTRGVVASYCGLSYVGIDVREEQIKTNELQLSQLSDYLKSDCSYILGDSREVLSTLQGDFDMAFTSPPFGNCEVYSDLPNDISTLSPIAFKEAYTEILTKTASLIVEGGWFVLNMGDQRIGGYYIDLPTISKQALYNVGFQLKNEQIILLPFNPRGRNISSLIENKTIIKCHEFLWGFQKKITKSWQML